MRTPSYRAIIDMAREYGDMVVLVGVENGGVGFRLFKTDAGERMAKGVVPFPACLFKSIE